MNKSIRVWNKFWVNKSNCTDSRMKSFFDLGKNIALTINDWNEDHDTLVDMIKRINIASRNLIKKDDVISRVEFVAVCRESEKLIELLEENTNENA